MQDLNSLKTMLGNLPRLFAAKADAADIADIEDESSATDLNYPDGFPSAYAVDPDSSGLRPLRKQMNAVGRIATSAEFAKRAGIVSPFCAAAASAEFASFVPGGYPQAAVVDFPRPESGLVIRAASREDDNTQAPAYPQDDATSKWDFIVFGNGGGYANAAAAQFYSIVFTSEYSSEMTLTEDAFVRLRVPSIYIRIDDDTRLDNNFPEGDFLLQVCPSGASAWRTLYADRITSMLPDAYQFINSQEMVDEFMAGVFSAGTRLRFATSAFKSGAAYAADQRFNLAVGFTVLPLAD